MRKQLLLLLILLTAASSFADRKHGMIVRAIDQKKIDSMVHHVPQENAIRLAQLKQTFKDVQCTGDDVREQSFGAGRNLVCTLPGDTSDTILFVAHYERGRAGMGAVDNWTGAAMLPLLYYALTASPRKHTFVFAEVDGEEGARACLQSLRSVKAGKLEAVVAVDALGLAAPSFYVRPNGTYPSPTEMLLETTLQLAATDRRNELPVQEIPGGWFKVDVTKPFRYEDVPTILIHSVNHDVHDIPGTAKDTVGAIDGVQYFETYNLLCYYIAELDESKIGVTAETPEAHPVRGRR